MKRITCLLMMLAALLCAALAEAPALPNIPAASEDRLAEAANAAKSALAFTNPEDAAVWPMLPAEEDGFACLTSTNWGVDGSASAVYAQVKAEAGDALAFMYKTSSELGFDLLQLKVNGEVVKTFTGEGDWGQYAHAFAETGTYEVAFVYSKDAVDGAGSDAVYIRNVQLLSGEAAAAALAANPAWPLAEERTLQVTTPGAREIVFDDPTFAMTGLHGLAGYFIVPEDAVDILVTLGPDDDPDGAVLNIVYDGSTHRLTDGAAADGYAFAVPLEASVTYIQMIPARDCSMLDLRVAVCFASEDAADELLRVMQGNGYQVHGWRYLDQVDCTLTVIDQYGEFVEGAAVQISANEQVIGVYTSDADGMIPFNATGEAFTARIVNVPEGYAFDAGRTWALDALSMDVIVDLTRVE